MKKIFALLIMLCGVLSSWAAYSTEGSTENVLKVSGAVTQAELAALLNQYKSKDNVNPEDNTDLNGNPDPKPMLLDFSEAEGLYASYFIENRNDNLYIRWGNHQMCILPCVPGPDALCILQNQLSGSSRFAYIDSSSDPSIPKTLYVWVSNGGDHSLSYLQYYSNKSSISLKFFPTYGRWTAKFSNYVSISRLEELSDVPALSIDFTWCDVVTLPTNFSVLNENTHYITIALEDQSGKYDFADETNEYEPGKKYTYGDHIYVVSTYKNSINNTDHYASGATFKGKHIIATEGTTISYVRQAGTFPNALKYFSDEMKEANLQCFCGNLVREDFTGTEDNPEGINSLVATKYDFVTATTTENYMKEFQNNYAKYLALPDNFNHLIDFGIEEKADYCYFHTATNPKCPNLLCVGAYNPTSNSLTTWSKENLDENRKQIASVHFVTSMVRPIPTPGVRKSPYNPINRICLDLSDVVMFGALNFDDISIGEYTTAGLQAAVLQAADLSKAYFPDNNDMNFAKAGWSYSKNGQPHCPSTIILPTDSRQALIPDDCFNPSKYGKDFFDDLVSICIPYNYKNIGDRAFIGARKLSHITATDNDGNVYNNGPGTYTFPASLAYDEASGNGRIGTEAFNLEAYNPGGSNPGNFYIGYTEVHDIYVLATTAPKCGVNAFSAGMVFGWGHFDGNKTHPVCRDNYKSYNHIITILHFPADTDDAEAKHYTDITRDYTLMDEAGAYDGQGNPLYWPLMEEFLKAYNQAMSGVTWADNTKYEGIVGTLTQSDGTAANTYNTEYAGWHQFVLTNYGHTIPTPPATNYYEDDYYTLCFPFDMSGDEVLSILGVKYDSEASIKPTLNGVSVTGDVFPKVYTLKGVTRIGSTITLEFCQDLMALAEIGWTIDVDATNTNEEYKNGYSYVRLTQRPSDGKDVYIKGGYPYLVKPILPEGKTISSGLAKYIMTKHAYTKNELGNKKVIPETTEYIAAPVLDHKVIARDGEGHKLKNGNIDYYYYFQGAYTYLETPETNTQTPLPLAVPHYAYFLGKKKGGSSKQFFRHTSATDRSWSAYSCVIGGKCPAEAAVINVEAKDGEIKGNDVTFKFTVDNDDFETADVKYKFTIEGEDGFDEAVNIEKIDGEVVNAAALEGDVFNVAGQRVGTSIEGLNKGLYIVNGKKVLVK